MSCSDDPSDGLLKPGQLIRPNISLSMVKTIVQNLYGLEVISCKELNSYDDKNYHIFVSAIYDNSNMEMICEDGYVLKIMNSLDSAKELYLDGQNSMMQFLGEKGFYCSQPIYTKDGKLKTLEKLSTENCTTDWIQNNDGIIPNSFHMIRLLTFIPGHLLNSVPITECLLYNCGKYIALLHTTLKGFSHPGFEGEEDKRTWSLKQIPNLVNFLHVIKEPLRLQLLNSVIQEFITQVLPNYDRLPKGYIHGDLNEQNILVQEMPYTSTSKFELLDFGDCQIVPFIFEIAIFICYMMLETKDLDPLLVAGYVFAGYKTDYQFSNIDMTLVRVCIASRMAQSLIMGAYTYTMDPGNQYLLTTAKTGWNVLEKFWSTPEENLIEMWKDIMSKYPNN